MALGPAFSSDRQAFGLPNITSEQDARWNEWRTRYREITTDDLRAAGVGGVAAARFTVGLNFAMKKFEINTTARQAAFLANVAVETKDPDHDSHIVFTSTEESAYPYSINAMRTTFKRLFPEGHNAPVLAVLNDARDIHNLAKKGVADPVKFFNYVYGGRVDLGNRPNTDDGYTYRGRGILGLTGRGRYLACGAAIGVDLVGNPDKVADTFYGCLAGAWAWCEAAFLQVGSGEKHSMNLNLIADLDTPEAFDKTCAGVNYGDIDAKNEKGQHVKINGLDKRQHQWPKFRHALHLRDLRLFHTRMAGVPARGNLFDDFKRPKANDDGMRPQFRRHAGRAH